MKKLRFKKVCRWSKSDGIFRLFRILWTAGKGPGVGGGRGNYSAKLSFALRPRLNFLRIRFHRSYGGHYV